MKTVYLTMLAALLAACAQSGSGQQEIYGEIKGGVETSHTRTSH
ncbi:lipoprotein [Neisseria zoodegmatis]|uniref:Lipoprotein n=1 Tax=Neisseria zoodegmatis TaxID=326523 RepID=A0A378WV21_9NEIS|nr:hypothetical protein [Neisseria zoodegmatis]SUA44321.1 lipoprotein [Neisseria zoodegmatis]